MFVARAHPTSSLIILPLLTALPSNNDGPRQFFLLQTPVPRLFLLSVLFSSSHGRLQPATPSRFAVSPDQSARPSRFLRRLALLLSHLPTTIRRSPAVATIRSADLGRRPLCRNGASIGSSLFFFFAYSGRSPAGFISSRHANARSHHCSSSSYPCLGLATSTATTAAGPDKKSGSRGRSAHKVPGRADQTHHAGGRGCRQGGTVHPNRCV